MVSFTLVTGNTHKLAEYRRLLPGTLSVDHAHVDLDEIQSLDSQAIVTHKVKQAYSILKRPVLVEDVAAGLDELQGLPGPFIKYFEQQLGHDALYQLMKQKDAATITCTLAYYDGRDLIIAESVIRGKVVAPKRISNFGFDCCFVPDGEHETYADMGMSRKDTIGHRKRALDALLVKLSSLNASKIE